MSVYIPSDNKLVTCPYDEAHKVKESRLQLHIAKCKLNHLDLEKKICPFNATHLLMKGEYDHHLMNCPDRGLLDRQLTQSVNKNNPYKGRTDVPQYSDPFIVEESWEIDQTPRQISVAPPIGAVIEPPAMSKPAQRKKLYQEMHQLPKENVSVTQTPPKPAAAPIRQPKQPSAVPMDNLGLGRGKPTSRIAANIFPKANDDGSQTASYSSMLCKDMSNLGLGRGKPVARAATAPAPMYEDEDFPALGCGRGGLGTKQSPRIPGSKSGK